MGAEKAYQLEFFGGRLLGAEIESPAYDQVAELRGALGYAVDRPGDLGSALKNALASARPAVIHVKIDPTAFNTLRKDLFGAKNNQFEVTGSRVRTKYYVSTSPQDTETID